MALQITLNGEPRTFEAPLTVATLLVALDMTAERVAVERNRRIIRRAEHAATDVVDGDVIEVVHFVGGG